MEPARHDDRVLGDLVSLDRITRGRLVGSGGQADVHECTVDGVGAHDLLIKIYKPPARSNLHMADLIRVVVKARSLSQDDSNLLTMGCAWPLAVVDDESSPAVILRKAPPSFWISSDRLRELQYVILAERSEKLGVELPSQTETVEILISLAKLVDVWHRNDIVHGDLSFRNVLWGARPQNRAFVLDCDSATIDGEQSALPAVMTPHWVDPRFVGKQYRPDQASDIYTLAAAIFRTYFRVRGSDLERIAADDDWPTDPRCPEWATSLFRRAFLSHDNRPSAAEWIESLQAIQRQATELSSNNRERGQSTAYADSVTPGFERIARQQDHPSPTRSRDLPSRLGPYVVVDRVAEASGAPMYKVFDKERDAVILWKPLPAEENYDAGTAKWAPWLRNDSDELVRVIEAVRPHRNEDGYVLMDYVKGLSLDQKQNLSVSEASLLAQRVLRALRHLGASGTSHLSIRPTKILVRSDDLSDSLLLFPSVNQMSARNPPGPTWLQPGLAKTAPSEPWDLDQWSLGLVLSAAILGRGAFREFDDIYDLASELELAAELPIDMVNFICRLLGVGVDKRYRNPATALAYLEELSAANDLGQRANTIVSLHGIRTAGSWQRSLADVLQDAGLRTRMASWHYGNFSLIRFLLPRSRATKVRWLRETYTSEFGNPEQGEAPSIVVHSFGSFILGYALKRYTTLRFDRVVLCGSILPRSFDWSEILDSGQVRYVRNEYGKRDLWCRTVGLVVPRTGSSGAHGFLSKHARLEQHAFDYSHSEYFEQGHMQRFWVRFLAGESSSSAEPIDPNRHADFRYPYALAVVLLAIFIVVVWSATVGW